jgi:tetratricopeptide (TPR) repeat protein
MAAPSAPNRWLFGPAPDLLLGCGVLYALASLPFVFAAPALRAAQPGWLLPLLILVVSMPHYGGTLLRVYEHWADRRAYAIFSLWATLLVAALFVAGVYVPTVASLLFTIYITWSPWHYTGQNYGIAVMFLRRRGVAITPAAKRWLYLSYILSFALTFVAFHGMLTSVAYSPDADAGRGVTFLPLGIPLPVTRVCFLVFGIGYLVSLGAAATLLLRGGSPRDLLPSAVLSFTQALWFTIPFAVLITGIRTGIDVWDAHFRVRDYTLFVALGHAAQYLWVTTYYARGSRGWSGYARYLGKAGASGIATWTLPVIVFAPHWLGRAEYAGGLALLVAAAVNIHHFILDGAIWKLRNTRIANVLIRSVSESPDASLERDGVWLRRGVWSLACAVVAVAAVSFWTTQISWNADGDRAQLARAAKQLDRLAWVGHDSSVFRLHLGRAFARKDDTEDALRQFERAAELASDDVDAYREIGMTNARAQRFHEAGAAFESALALAPDDANLAFSGARAWLRAGEPRRANEILTRAIVRHPDLAALHEALGDAENELGDGAGAAQHWGDAFRISPERVDAGNNLAWLLATSEDASVRDPERAIALAQQLAAGRAEDANALDTLAAAYAAAGRFAEAVDTASRAAALARAAGNTRMGEEIERRVALYRDARPYLEMRASAQAPQAEPAADPS